MSYLDLPRIHALGRFFTDPSTVNNDPSHYDPDVERPSPWQAPNGLHRFMLVDVKVVSALDTSGTFVEQDPLLGAEVISTDKPTPAKIVDLDVYQQSVPTIFGLQISIDVGDGTSIVGSMDACAANGLRFTRVLPTRGWSGFDGYGQASFGGDTNACAIYLGVLRVDPTQWPAASDGVLRQLREATATDADGNILISIRMVVDDYQNVPWHDDFSHGRMLATLGPVSRSDELETVVGGRWMNPRPVSTGGDPNAPADPWYWPDFYGAPGRFAERSDGQKSLSVDIANAIALVQPGGNPVPLGELSVVLGNDTIGTFQATQDLYQNFGGIIDLSVTDAQWAARDAPLSIRTSRDDIGGPALWSESASGLNIEAADRVFRLPGYAGQVATARVKVTRWGDAAVGFQPGIMVVPVVEGVAAATVPPPAKYPGDTSQADGALTATISAVDETGVATVTLTVHGDPGSRTEQLDGQLYFIVVYDPAAGAPDMTKSGEPPQEAMISCIVFSAYSETPSWEEVKRLMTPYAKLYPGMTDQIDLTQEQAFFTFALNPPWQAYGDPHIEPYVLPDGRKIMAGAIPYVMTRGFDDPQYMPVTRDLSPQRRTMILSYIADVQATAKPTPPPPGAPT